MTYTDLWTIVQNAQKGSGYTRSKETTRAKTVLDSLARKGWSKSYLKTALHNLDDELLTGWPEELFQESYMKETVQLHSTLEESLLRKGIKPLKARETVAAISPLKNTCYTDKQLLEIAIEYILGKYDPLTAPNVSHFAQPENLNIWIPTGEKYFLNTTYSCRYTAVKRFEQLIYATFPSHDGKIFFHTTNWRGALNIMDYINREQGRPCLDFGISPSFYVSESASDAIDWGVKNSSRWHDEVAILAFYLPNNFQKDFKFRDLTENTDEWNWAVTAFRNCKLNKEIYKYDNAFDFMYGPMLANPVKYTTEGPLMHKPPVMQLSAKNNTATEYLYQCMKGAFVFRKL